MKKSRLLDIVLVTATLLLSNYSSAAIISTDWQVEGDGLITHDTDTGLEWLDLTFTANLSYNFVDTQLNVGGLLEGFRYATSAEVFDLLAEWDIVFPSTSLGITNTAGLDPGLIPATQYLGNIFCDANCTLYPYGVRGFVNEVRRPGEHYIISAHYLGTGDATYYGVDSGYDDEVSTILGSYLVRSASGPAPLPQVPLPLSVWLFGSGLLGLIGVARQKNSY
jgi:hypothetical protein